MAPSYFLVGNFDTYQLLINTPTTIITFLLVALLQNTQMRNEQAMHNKLDVIADALSYLMRQSSEGSDESDKDIEEDLKAAVALEEEM